MDQHLTKLAADYAAAVRDLSGNHFSRNGDRFRFTADGHTVEISFDEELPWRILADGVMVKEADEEDDSCPSAFEEAWLILAKLIRPTETEAKLKTCSGKSAGRTWLPRSKQFATGRKSR